jgi:hypothetical protein
MNILNFQAFIITVVLIAIVIVFISNKMNYLELGFIGFGIFLVVITFMDHVDKKHYIVKEEDEYNYVFPEEKIVVEETDTPVEVESNLPLLDKTGGPLDSLTPQELSKRLKYIYYATSHPYKKVSYKDYETHADKLIHEDNSSLAPDDDKYHNYLLEYYPELTKNQISTRDCLNGGYGKNSCYQHPKLFNNLGNESILDKGVNQKNQHYITREDFSSLQNLDNTPLQSIMYNAPSDPSQQRLIDKDLCRGCTVGLCSTESGCSQQNELFF